MVIKHVVIGSIIIGLIAAANYKWALGLTYVIIVPALLLFPRWFYNRSRLKEKLNDIFLLETEYMFLVGVLLAALGEGFIYNTVPGFDSFVHFINGILLTIFIVSINYEQWLAGISSPIRIVLTGGVLPAVANEIYEFSADEFFFGVRRLWGDNFKPLALDTISDVTIQITGSIIAVLILKRYLPSWLKRWQRQENF